MKRFEVCVRTREQLEAVLQKIDFVRRIYVSFELFYEGDEVLELLRSIKSSDAELYATLPYMTREEEGSPDLRDLEIVCQMAGAEQRMQLKEGAATDISVEGALVRNLEQLSFLAEQGFEGDIVLDSQVYIWNANAIKELLEDELLAGIITGYTLPLEQNVHEWTDTLRAAESELMPSVLIYGRVPMMVSAGCVLKTMQGCSGHKGQFETQVLEMEDRTGRKLPVECSCRYCYNVIRNAYPISLHHALFSGRLPEKISRRLEFATETKDEALQVLDFFGDCSEHRQPPYREYTTGRFQKGVD